MDIHAYNSFPSAESFTLGNKILEILSISAQLIPSVLVFVICAVLLKIDEVRRVVASILIKIKKVLARES